MSEIKEFKEQYEKTEAAWPIGVQRIEKEIQNSIWVTTQWELTGFELSPEDDAQDVCLLQLHKDERTDYRFNLSSQQPKLFLVMDNVDSGVKPVIQLLTASQTVAGQYMDGDNQVLSYDIPLPVQAWMEAFIGRHGELLEARRKKRKGAGRSNATNFFSRWSQRKLDESTDEPLEAQQTLEETELTSSEASIAASSIDVEASESLDREALENESPETNEEVHASDVQDPAPEATEDLSVAQLLVSEASESVKKAALRKLFLSEEFNVRDGLDDYDDDYSNLKSLSEGVAETLRDWVKDKTEEETTLEEEQIIDSKDESEVLEHSESGLEVSDNELETSESAEITEQEKQLYKNTVSDKSATTSDEDNLKEMGQNIPHKE